VLKAIHPSWCTTQVPSDVAELLGCQRAELKGLHRPARAIAFLSRGPGNVRALGTYRSAEMLAGEMAANRVIAMAQLTDKLVFNMPAALEEYLGIQSYPRGGAGTRGTDDMIVWYMPEDEYYEYRLQTRDGKPFKGLTSGNIPHVYLTKSVFQHLRKNIAEEPLLVPAHPAPLRLKR
jgi:hypothetical protein